MSQSKRKNEGAVIKDEVTEKKTRTKSKAKAKTKAEAKTADLERRARLVETVTLPYLRRELAAVGDRKIEWLDAPRVYEVSPSGRVIMHQEIGYTNQNPTTLPRQAKLVLTMVAYLDNWELVLYSQDQDEGSDVVAALCLECSVNLPDDGKPAGAAIAMKYALDSIFAEVLGEGADSDDDDEDEEDDDEAETKLDAKEETQEIKTKQQEQEDDDEDDHFNDEPGTGVGVPEGFALKIREILDRGLFRRNDYGQLLLNLIMTFGGKNDPSVKMYWRDMLCTPRVHTDDRNDSGYAARRVWARISDGKPIANDLELSKLIAEFNRAMVQLQGVRLDCIRELESLINEDWLHVWNRGQVWRDWLARSMMNFANLRNCDLVGIDDERDWDKNRLALCSYFTKDQRVPELDEHVKRVWNLGEATDTEELKALWKPIEDRLKALPLGKRVL